MDGNALVLRFELTNRTAAPVEVGGLGIPIVFNNVLNGRSLDQAHAICFFYDPYIGMDAGYLQVTRLSGAGTALIVVPEGRTPFEAYRAILDLKEPRLFTDLMRHSVTFEGIEEWVVHSRVFAKTDWKSAVQWNPPTSATLAPGQSRTYGVRFIVSPGIREIEKTLADSKRPVPVGIPGCILPTDIDATLFVKSQSRISSILAAPRDAVTVTPGTSAGGWARYLLRAGKLGRVRLVITYEDGTAQTVHYLVTKSEEEAVQSLGQFLTTRQWFDDPNDPFKRGPSIMTNDLDEDRIVTQDTQRMGRGVGR